MCWVKRSELSCDRTLLQYCCCLIAILTAWKQSLKISHREGSTRVKNDHDVMCLPAHDVTVIIFATFKMCYEHFHSTELQYSAYLSQILWYKRYLFLLPMSFNQAALRVVLKPENMSSSSQATQIPVRFVCVYASSTLPFIAVFNRCLDHCFWSFRLLFQSLSIDYKTLELNYFVFVTFICCLFWHAWVALKSLFDSDGMW